MSETLIQILISAVVAVVASVLSLQAVRIQERRLRQETAVKDKQVEADNADKISNAALKLLEPYEKRLVEMQKLQEIHEKQIRDLECELQNERKARKEMEQTIRDQTIIISQKDNRMAEMQDEINALRHQIEELQNNQKA